MLKRCTAVIIVFILAIALLSSNSLHNAYANAVIDAKADNDQAVEVVQDNPNSTIDENVVNIYTCNMEMADIFTKYAGLNPDFKFVINYTPDAAGSYYREILGGLENAKEKAIDIYCVPGWYAEEFIKGEYAGYASTYKQLGIDVDFALTKADIPQYAIDAGSNSDGEIVTLPYEAKIGVFMYRRSIAKTVWGTDDPDTIADILGAGTEDWDKFVEAAKTLKKHGYYIAPGWNDIWPFVDTRIPKDEDLNPQWEAFMDISKHLLNKNYIGESLQYSEQWINDLDGKGDNQIFGLATSRFFEWEFTLGNTYGDWAICQPPISNIDLSGTTAIFVSNKSQLKDKIKPLIEWITLDSTETGLQYCLANDNLSNQNNAFYGAKRPVVSGSVLKSVNSGNGFLGGQNINTVYYNTQVASAVKQQGYNSLEGNIVHAWRIVTDEYLTGRMDKATAIANFKEQAKLEYQWLETYYYDPAINTALNIYSMDQELDGIVKKYAELHPEFKYKIHSVQGSMIDDNHFLAQVVDALENGDGNSIDIYSIPSIYAKEFIDGRYSDYASTYQELGIDVDAAIKKADIPQFAIDAGTNQSGEIIALPYETSVYTFMYRRSIAKKVWGTDDPDEIAEIIGTGSDNWAKFVEAAQTLKKHGYYITPGCYGYWPLFTDGIDAYNQTLNGNHTVYPKWEEFLDISKLLFDNGCIKDTDPYTEQWYQDLDGKGDKPVFGLVLTDNQISYLGDASYLPNTAGDWAICRTTRVNTFEGTHSGIMVNKNSPLKEKIAPLIEWMTLDCSENGLQYRLANDTLYRNGDVVDDLYEAYGNKRAVISGTIMKNTINTIDFLGGENVNSIIYNTIKQSNGKKYEFYTSLDSTADSEWLSIVRAYLNQGKSKDAAIAEFKANMNGIETKHKEYLETIY